ncbi:hypothetical protein ACVRY6_04660 [Streptococcus ictaluri]|uniref:Uncharacterized protein n=2 Tax=Streptococcus ictaluri TaxID=380397 RepID=G5K6A6_9STRE|nr:hypothetical protein STRIC_0593 [Streptococcus ictaluri 707-05]
MSGTSFWFAFLFETPFAIVFRSPLFPLIYVIYTLYLIKSFVNLRRKGWQ